MEREISKVGHAKPTTDSLEKGYCLPLADMDLFLLLVPSPRISPLIFIAFLMPLDNELSTLSSPGKWP